MLFRLRTQLLILSLGLLVLPWLGYRYIDDMQRFLLKGQEQAQLLTTQAIATALQDRPDLLNELPHVAADSRQTLLYAYPTDINIVADGYSEEWQHTAYRPQQFTPAAPADRLDPLAMTVGFLQRGNELYLLIQVRDRYPVYRHPGFSRLDKSDHIRLAIDDRHFVITSEAVGAVQVFNSNSRWHYPQPGASEPIQGGWVETPEGYQVELQLPLALVSKAASLTLTVVDIDDPLERKEQGRVGTATPNGSRLLVHSPELQRLIRGLQRSDRHIWILDRHRQIRALSNTADASPNLLQRHQSVIDRALSGLPALARYRDGKRQLILAAQPITGDQAQPLGVAVVEVAADDILDLQRTTLLKSGAATALALLLLTGGLLLFAYRLTRRIRRLQQETRSCVDTRGRLVKAGLQVEQRGRDEVSELARDLSTLVGRLSQYTGFLERMPRTLRHELSNPLNTISTSLEMLRDQASQAQQPYLDSAERGARRLNLIITSLTEAASLEEALESETLEPLDLSRLLQGYGQQLQNRAGDHEILLQLPTQPAWIAGNDLRLEQLLDKLVDNALAFAELGSPIRLQLAPRDAGWQFSIHNRGPAIPQEIEASLFDSLVSLREGGADPQGCHLGIGLFVVKTIAEHHHARVRWENEQGGVAFYIDFPGMA